VYAAYAKVLLVAAALALDVFAVSVGVGVRGVPRRRKVLIGLTFATAEVAMNIVGAALGVAVGRVIGNYAGYVGFAALFVLGIYMMRESRTTLGGAARLDLSSGHGLLVAALAVSLDSLGVGFSILYLGVPVEIALGTIFVVSILATTLGLALGRWLGRYAEQNAALIGGALLSLTGLVFAVLKALRLG
jgi:manganese efflux pump family protein